jgi:FkbM family methyltransferase
MKILQLGASIGNDHVTQLVQSIQNLELLVLVEPNVRSLDRLKECYRLTPNVCIENLAIVPNYDSGHIAEMFFAERDGEWGYQVTSMFKSHLEKHLYDTTEIESFHIKCITLHDLLTKHNIIELDYLYIDIEGMDEDVLLSLNLEKYNIKNICVEVLHMNRVDEVYNFLKRHGYTEARAPTSFDKMFVKS